MIKVGCCGFAGGMANYFKKFKVAEVQQTFYKPPRIETAKKWRSMAPSDFEFTLKAWQVITHPASSPTYRKAGIEAKPSYGFFKVNDDTMQAWDATKEIAKALNSKIIIFQCPASFKENEENIKNMKEFFSSVSHDLIFGWEPRGNWKEETIRRICEELDLIHVVDPFKNESLYGMPKYYRLHGMKGYNYDYSIDELKKLKEVCLKHSEAYCMFNNTKMLKNAMEFMELLEKK
ncbi:MAG: DUF72 domain-containing protein [Thermoplasmata archaeon]|nr:DUF72 domain-containing protein [Thermoplasmata archaeon]